VKLITLRPVPPASLAIQLVINGDVTSIHCSPQTAADGQAMQADRDVAMTGQRTAAARLRKRGVIVALSIIVGAIAAVVGTAVAICVWVGWTP